MKRNFVRMIVVMLVLISMVSMFAACSDSSSPNDPSKQKEWEVVGIHPGVRGSNGIAVEYYIVTAIDDENGVHAVAIQPHQIEIVENGTVKLDDNTLYITIDDFVAFINNQKTSVEVND